MTVRLGLKAEHLAHRSGYEKEPRGRERPRTDTQQRRRSSCLAGRNGLFFENNDRENCERARTAQLSLSPSLLDNLIASAMFGSGRPIRMVPREIVKWLANNRSGRMMGRQAPSGDTTDRER